MSSQLDEVNYFFLIENDCCLFRKLNSVGNDIA